MLGIARAGGQTRGFSSHCAPSTPWVLLHSHNQMEAQYFLFANKVTQAQIGKRTRQSDREQMEVTGRHPASTPSRCLLTKSPRLMPSLHSDMFVTAPNLPGPSGAEPPWLSPWPDPFTWCPAPQTSMSHSPSLRSSPRTQWDLHPETHRLELGS